MSTAVIIVVAIAALVAGAIGGWLFQQRAERGRSGTAEAQSAEVLERARGEADRTKRDAELQAKELLLQAKTEAEEEASKRLGALQAEQERLLKREEALEGKVSQLDAREAELSRKEGDLAKREGAAEANARAAQDQLAKASQRLEELAKLNAEQARALLIEQMRDEAKQAAAAEIRKVEEETEQVARERATNIIAQAIQRHASEYVSERTVSVVQLPGDEMKGRIIGREGRNIRALEAATGVDLIIDDTPDTVILSCFNPVRREVARLTLSRLIADGRIHPSRIEEVVKRCTEEVDAGCKESGEQTVFDLGLHRVHPELIHLLGQLKFRSAYAQNLLQHSVEVGYIAGMIAAELGLGVKQARRAGLLHDIGKAADQEVEGTHAAIGAALAKKYGESPKVVHAIAAHHGEVEPSSVLAHIVDAANQLSNRRPGARRARLQSYIQRLHDLEQLCTSFEGVEKAYAIQAGREVRVMVQKDEITDDLAVMLSKDLARKIENEMSYAGQVKVCVIRQSRATDMAR